MSASARQDRKLINADLAPLSAAKKNWRAYDLFAMWMTDVHSIGGYVFAASLFATGLTGWQVLLSMLAGVAIVNGLMNLIGKPSQILGVPFPVAARIAFGVFGANIPALARAVIGIVWFGVQTYLASVALELALLRLVPALEPWSSATTATLGLSALGWSCYLAVWFLQVVILSYGMESVRRFVEFAGPAVYLVMFIMAFWIVNQVGLGGISLSLTDADLSGSAAWIESAKVAALVVGYFSAVLLSFGDFSRYCASPAEMKRGNLLGLPLNWMVFASVAVVITSGTATYFGEALLDPMDVVQRIDNVTALLFACLTLLVATLGINIVANFVAPAFDLANLAPSRVTFRTGGFITAAIALVIMPWHLVESPEAISLFVGTMGGFLGPVYAIIVTDYYLVRRKEVVAEDLFDSLPSGAYWYYKGVNLRALAALAPAVALSVVISFWPVLSFWAPLNWFVSAGVASVLYLVLNRRRWSADTR